MLFDCVPNHEHDLTLNYAFLAVINWAKKENYTYRLAPLMFDWKLDRETRLVLNVKTCLKFSEAVRER